MFHLFPPITFVNFLNKLIFQKDCNPSFWIYIKTITTDLYGIYSSILIGFVLWLESFPLFLASVYIIQKSIVLTWDLRVKDGQEIYTFPLESKFKLFC